MGKIGAPELEYESVPATIAIMRIRNNLRSLAMLEDEQSHAWKALEAARLAVEVVWHEYDARGYRGDGSDQPKIEDYE